jgi:hypothetical protein
MTYSDEYRAYEPEKAPPRSDPAKLAPFTVAAVDQIGEAAAAELDAAAQTIVKDADLIAARLVELAAAVREHSRIEGERVAVFCEKTTTVLESMRGLTERLDAIDAAVPQSILAEARPAKRNGGER